jgi:hypothetical protein
VVVETLDVASFSSRYLVFFLLFSLFSVLAAGCQLAANGSSRRRVEVVGRASSRRQQQGSLFFNFLLKFGCFKLFFFKSYWHVFYLGATSSSSFTSTSTSTSTSAWYYY